MQKSSLTAQAREQLQTARQAAGDVSWDGSPGDLLVVPDSLHSLEALEDAAVLLTVAKLS